MIALFRDYDVTWPGATNAAMGWFEVLNVGFSMMAPGQHACCPQQARRGAASVSMQGRPGLPALQHAAGTGLI
jgi:hypothetical protein